MMDRNEPVEVDAELKGETGKALRLWDGRTTVDECGKEIDLEVWVPKSKCTCVKKDVYEMPYWMAKEKGFI